MAEQSGLLHTWGHLHKTMTKGLRHFLTSAPEASLHLEDVHLPSLYRQMSDRGTHVASALGITFKPRYDDRLPLVIRGNASLLRRTVATALDHVMDWHASGVGYTAFEVNLTEDDGWDYISFTSWCAGVRKNEDDHPQTWFNREELEELVTLMGGSFLAEDRRNTEPRYTIGIPLISGDPSNVMDDSPETFTIGLTQAKDATTALVVDGSPVSRALGVRLLSRHNIKADVAERGRIALRKLVDERYDLIFMDHAMPGALNAVQTATIAHKKGLLEKSFVIGMHSGTGTAENMEAAFFEAGMQGYLDKPVDPFKLNHLLLDLLPRLHRQATGAPEQADAPDTADGARAGLIRSLSGIAGLDAENGLAHMGHSVEIYASMLRRFTAELEEYIEPLLTLPLDGAWEEVAIRLHVLREFFVGIGAADLAQKAAELAAAAETGGGSEYMPSIQSYCDDMMRLRARLVRLKAEDSREKTDERREPARMQAAQADMETLRQQISRLRDACLSYRATEAQRTADSLRAMALSGDIQEQIEMICALVGTLDYHEAQEQCARVLEMITPPERDAEK